MHHNCINVVKTNQPEISEVTVSAEIPVETISKHRAQAIKAIGKDLKVDGFRTGHIPEAVLIAHVGEAAIMREAANSAIGEELPMLLAVEQIPAIDTPKVTITKLAPGNPLTFTAQVQVMPTVTLPDYKTIAKKLNAKNSEVTVSETEVDETVMHLRREHARITKIELGIEPAQAAKDAGDMKVDDLPQLDDVFAKTIGFKTADEFNKKLRENIKNEKEMREREKRRIAIVEAIIKDANIPVPNVFIEQELDSIEARFGSDLERGGTTIDAYLTHSKKTREDLRTEWKDAAKKRAKMHLVLREIALKENIVVNPLDIDREVEHIKAEHKNVNPEAARGYVETTMRIETVFKWLEEQK